MTEAEKKKRMNLEDTQAMVQDTLRRFNSELIGNIGSTDPVYYTQAEADAYNAELDGALNSTDALTAEQAAAYNAAITGGSKVTGDTLTEQEAHAYNATLEGAVSTSDIKTPAVPKSVKQYVDDKFLSKCINTTYDELKGWRDNGQLVPGQWYRITDYVTTTVQADTRSAGHQFDVIVMALTENTLSEDAYADYHEGDTYFHNTSNNNKYHADLNKWQLRYRLDNDTNRFAWASSNGKGVIYYMKDEWYNECPYDFKNIQFKRYRIGAIFCKASSLSSIFTTMLTTGINATLYYAGNDWGDSSGRSLALNLHQGESIVEGTTLTDEYAYYGGTTFTIDPTAKYMKITEDIYAQILGEGWVYTFTASCSSITTFENSAGEDMTRWTTGKQCSNIIKPCYTKESDTKKIKLNNIIIISSGSNTSKCNTFEKNCYDITLGAYTIYNKFGEGCHNITIEHGYNLNDTTGSSPNGYNTFGTKCYNILLCTLSYFNLFGDSCHDIYSAKYMRNSNIGNYSYNITAIEGIEHCNFGIECSNIVLRKECDFNSFDNEVSNIALYQAYKCSFGNSVNNIIASLVDNPGYNDLNGFLYNVIVNNAIQYLNLKVTATTSVSMPARNIKICQGVSGTTEEPKEIVVDTVGQDYQIEYKNANSQIIEV